MNYKVGDKVRVVKIKGDEADKSIIHYKNKIGQIINCFEEGRTFDYELKFEDLPMLEAFEEEIKKVENCDKQPPKEYKYEVDQRVKIKENTRLYKLVDWATGNIIGRLSGDYDYKVKLDNNNVIDVKEDEIRKYNNYSFPRGFDYMCQEFDYFDLEDNYPSDIINTFIKELNDLKEEQGIKISNDTGIAVIKMGDKYLVTDDYYISK